MNATVSFATKARWSDAWPGRLERLDRQPAGLERALDDLDAVALDELRVAGDVVGVRVRRQQVRHVQALALDDLVQRLERRAAVDEDRRAAGLVREQVRVREPVRDACSARSARQDRNTARKDRGPRWPLPLSGCARSARPRAPGPLPRARAAASEEAPQEPAPAERSPQRRPPRRSRRRPRRARGGSDEPGRRQSDRGQHTAGSGDLWQRQRRRQLEHLVHDRCRHMRRLERRHGARRARARRGVRRRGGRHNGRLGRRRRWIGRRTGRRRCGRTRPLRRTRRCRPDGTDPDARRLRRTRFRLRRSRTAAGSASPCDGRVRPRRGRPACGTGTATLAPAIVSTAAPSAPAARGVRLATSIRDNSPASQPGSGGRKTGRRSTRSADRAARAASGAPGRAASEPRRRSSRAPRRSRRR